MRQRWLQRESLVRTRNGGVSNCAASAQKSLWRNYENPSRFNMLLGDGHAAYSKYERLTSLDFGLLDVNGKLVPWEPSEASSRQRQFPAF